jgi:hypothetical protein
VLEFFPTNYEEIYQTLVNNDRLMKFLNEKDGLVLKESMLYDDYDKSILNFMKAQLKLENINTFKELAKLLLDNDSVIVSNTMDYLMEHRTLFDKIKKVFGDVDIDEETYKEIFYCYKYCYTSSFFQNNSSHFIPEYDINQVENNEMLAPFMDAINKEFDKLDYMLNASRKYISFDDIPFQYINYLCQMLGFETKDIYNATEQRYREIMKNIIDIFKIKGTNYSFELFFQFLGFNIKISEYYFDRRLYYRIDGYNPETGKIAKNDFEYYLTTVNPVNNILANISINEPITLADFTPQYSLLEFNDLVRQYGAEAVTGYSSFDSSGRPYTNKVYKYFKSNYVYYDIGLPDRNLSQDETNAVVRYLEFLTPVYIAKKIQIRISLGSEEDDQIRFDGDGKGNGDRLGVLPDEFEMLDSEDWGKYNNDERTHDGLISGTQDSQYKRGERFPIVNRWARRKTTRYDNEGLYPKLMFKRLLRWYDYETGKFSIDHTTENKNEQNIINDTTKLINEYITSYGRNLDQIRFFKRQPNNSLDYNGPEGKNIDDWVRWNAYVERRVDYLLNKVEKNTTKESTNVDKINIDFVAPLNPITVEDFVSDSSFNELRIEKSANLINTLVAEFSYGVDYSYLYSIAYHFNSYIELLNFYNGQQTVNQDIKSKYMFEGCYISVDNNNKIQIYQLVPSTLYTSLMFELYVEEIGLGWDSSLQVLEPISTDLNFISIEAANTAINEYKDSILNGTKEYYEKEQLIEEYTRSLVFIQAQNRYYIIRKKILPSGFVQNFANSMFDTYEDALSFFTANPSQCYNFRLFWVNENWVDSGTNILYDRGYYRFVYKNRRVDTTFYDDITGYLYAFDRGIKLTDIKQINYKGRPVIENDKCVIYEYDPHWKGYSEEQDEEDFIFYNTPGQDAKLDSNSKYYLEFTDRHYVDYYNVHNFIYRPVFEIEERKFDEYTDGIWVLERILDRSVEAFSDGELHSHEEIGDEPTSLTGIIENYLEEPGTVSQNTLRQYFTSVKKFVVEFYKYLVLREPLPNGSILSNILGPETGTPPTYQYEEYWWNTIYDYTNTNSNTIVKAVCGFILKKIKEALPEILKNAIEHNHAVPINPDNPGATVAEMINQNIINWFETYDYPGVFNKDYVDNYSEDPTLLLTSRITSDFFSYIQTFVNTYEYPQGQYSTQRYIEYIRKFFNDYYDTFLTPYHEFLSLIKIFRQQVKVHSNPTDENSSLTPNPQTDPNIRLALKYYLLSVLYNEKLSLYRERYMSDGELNASFKNFGEFEYIYYAPKAEFNGQSGYFNFPKTLEHSKNNYKKDHYNSRNLPFYGFSMNSNGFVLNVSFYVKENDFNNLLSSYYRITNIINYIDSLPISNDDKEYMKQNLTETYNAQFECIIPVLYLNEFDFSKKNTGQSELAEQFQTIVFNKELSNSSIQFTGLYIIFSVSIPIDNKKISITVDETLKDYPIGYLRINYLKTVYKENIISVPYKNCHNWIKMDNENPSRFLSLGSADKIVRNIKNKILTDSNLLEQYKDLGDFTGTKDIIGIGEDGNQYVNKVINLYEKNKQEFNNIFKITTKNIKSLNIKTIKLIYGEIYHFFSNPKYLEYWSKYSFAINELIKPITTNLYIEQSHKVTNVEHNIFKNIDLNFDIEYLINNIEDISAILSIDNIIDINNLIEILKIKEDDIKLEFKAVFAPEKIQKIDINAIDIILSNSNNLFEIKKILDNFRLNYTTDNHIIAFLTIRSDWGISYISNIDNDFRFNLIEILWDLDNLKLNFDISSNFEIFLKRFVAVASNSNVLAYSEDGITWSTVANIPNADWRNVTYANGKFIAVAYNSDTNAYSTNGIDWTPITMPVLDDWEGIAYGNGKFVATSSNDGKVAYSINGIDNWTLVPSLNGYGWENVVYGNGKFVTVAGNKNDADSYSSVAYSTDGINWTLVNNAPNPTYWENVGFGNGKFVAVGKDYIMYSTDGIAWTSVDVSSYTSAIIRNVTYGNGKFVAVASGSNVVLYSSDGITWNTAPISNGSWFGINYVDNKFIAVGNNVMAYSTDGLSWTSISGIPNNNWRAIAYKAQ